MSIQKVKIVRYFSIDSTEYLSFNELNIGERFIIIPIRTSLPIHYLSTNTQSIYIKTNEEGDENAIELHTGFTVEVPEYIPVIRVKF